MATMILKNVPPYDGSYELDEDRAFNAREWRIIKKAGYMPMTVADGFEGRDPDLFIALAVISLIRSGKVAREDWETATDVISEAPWDGTAITMVGDQVEDDIPLDSTSEPDESSQTSSLEKQSSSGPDLRSSSGRSDVTPSVTSLLRSGTS